MRTVRKQNIVWTVSEDYHFEPSFLLFHFQRKESDYYKYALAGLAYKYYEFTEIENFYLLYKEGDFQIEEIRRIIEITIENLLWDTFIKERPGVLFFRKKYMSERLHHYHFHSPNNLSEELEYAFYSVKENIVPKSAPLVIKLLDRLLDLDEKSTSLLIKKLEKIINDFFHINPSLKMGYAIDKIIDQTKWKEENKRKNRLEFKRGMDTIPKREELDSAELARSYFSSENEEKDTDSLSHQLDISSLRDSINMEKTAIEIYGQPILPPHVIEKMERELCVDVHKGVRLLITDGKYGDSLNEQFRNSERLRHKENNREHFDNNSILYRRSISKLTRILQQYILADKEDILVKSYSGTLTPSRLWRYEKLNDPRVFEKEIKDQQGKITVDILLDSSASQQDRQELVAAQGYIIASALRKLNIPVRVTGFSNFSNVQIIKLFRDYEDDDIKNDKIFEYQASGSNRDGLAIKTVLALMDRSADDNILIILSDGRPNDKVNVGILGIKQSSVVNYTGEMAIKDSAKEVFQGRMNDTIVFGIFTGKEEDLEQEKRIYGNDFVYIHQIERFSETVGNFLKQIIEKNQ